MMTPKEVLGHVTAEPFRPFRIRMASGETYEVKHPETVQVGKTNLTLFTPLIDDTPGSDMWHKLSLMLLEAIEPLGASGKRERN
jgi:hypothetical protein